MGYQMSLPHVRGVGGPVVIELLPSDRPNEPFAREAYGRACKRYRSYEERVRQFKRALGQHPVPEPEPIELETVRVVASRTGWRHLRPDEHARCDTRPEAKRPAPGGVTQRFAKRS